jgi:biopolymer transport protein ExbD
MSQRSRHNVLASAGVNLGLIITPMLDMSFQILAFFIMNYHPSALEAHVDGKLVANPAVHGKDTNVPADPNLLPPDEPELETTLHVIVKAIPKGNIERTRTDGQPAQIYIKKPEDGQPKLIADTDEPLASSLKKLKSQLKTELAGGGAMKSSIRLDCGGDMKHQYVMEIYDICKSAGFQNISFVAPAPAKKAE